jgi:alkaline phosphatase D
MAIGRRNFLKASAAQSALLGARVTTGIAASSVIAGCGGHPGAAPVRHGANPFVHGVASGDPLADRVILWTRVSPDALRVGEPIAVDWWIGRDADGLDRVSSGRVEALAERDFTVKIDATGLEADTNYYYRFSAPSGPSPLGRTRTLPSPDSKVEQLRFAVASCSNYPEGFFNPYGAIALRDDIDLVLHLGDYIYEYGNGEYGDGTAIGRIPDPVHEILSLEDYRRRHATYKADPDLRAAHARHPWITVWDDHESADNSYATGAVNHNPVRLEGRWSKRRLAAIRAYHEWMPIRELPTGLYREFQIGDLAHLIMLDTRLAARDPHVGRTDHEAARALTRTLLGEEQEAHFLGALSKAEHRGTPWKIVGQQVIVSPLTDGTGGFNPDTWDGYRESRRRVLDHLADESIEGVVFLTGDYHSSWAFEVPPPLESDEVYDPETGDGARAVEFVAPAVSSIPVGRSPRARKTLADALTRYPHLKYLDLEQQGYILLDLTRDRVRAHWMYTGESTVRSSVESCGAIQESRRGTNRLESVTGDGCPT